MFTENMENPSFVLTISYGDYTIGTGGTDKVILSQEKMFRAQHISVVHIFPRLGIWQRKPRLMWGMLIDGTYKACFLMEQIVSELNCLADEGKTLKAVLIHHLQWINPEDVAYLCARLDVKVYFYVHDYMTACPHGGLVYNQAYFCGTGRPDGKKCTGCRFFTEENARKLKITDALLDQIRTRLTVIAPSETAAVIWEESHRAYADAIVVLPHQRLAGAYKGNLQRRDDREALRVAFVGYQSGIKGWPQWIEAVHQARKQGCNYDYFQFGTVNEHFEFITEIAVDFKKSLTAMTDSLRKYQIDIAVLWSVWPETYSYTYYESLAANCFVLTNAASGNICQQVRRRGNGLIYPGTCLSDILPDEQRLRAERERFREKCLYGPEQLIENDDILKRIESE